MALQTQFEFDNGIILPETYVKISAVTYNNSEKIVNIVIVLFKDISAYNNNKSEVISLEYFCDNPTEFDTYFGITVLNKVDVNHLSQAYTWLKTLPEFSSAIDV